MGAKTPKDIRERRKELRSKRPQEIRTTTSLDWKFWVGTLIALVSLGLTIVGLPANPSVSLEPPLDPANVLTTPFVIANDTYFDLTDVRAAAVFRDVKTTLGSVGAISVGWNALAVPTALNAGEKRTIPYPFTPVTLGGTVLAGEFGLVIS